MGKRGENTKPAQQRKNIRMSRERLVKLLASNFMCGAQLVTLNYDRDGYVPERKLAITDHCNWIRRVRVNLGCSFQYIRTTGWPEGEQSYPVHRCVLGVSAEAAARVAALWEYGETKVETVQPDKMEDVAAFLMGKTLDDGRVTFPCKHTWAASRSVTGAAKHGQK